MSFIVSGLRMPENCVECPFEKFIFDDLWYECPLLDGKTVNSVRDSGRLPDCPLVKIPDKHGRLIDVDAFKADHGMKDDCADCEKELRGKVKACEYDYIYSKMDLCYWLDDADIVIEAEGE